MKLNHLCLHVLFLLCCCMYDSRIIYLRHDVSNSSNYDYPMFFWYYGMTNTVRPWAAQPYPLLISTGFLKYPLELKKKNSVRIEKKNQL